MKTSKILLDYFSPYKFLHSGIPFIDGKNPNKNSSEENIIGPQTSAITIERSLSARIDSSSATKEKGSTDS